jgi:hypothetical protein
MSHPSPFLTFQSLFDVALHDYENQTGTRLADHPLAKQLEACDSVVTITAFLQERVRAFHGFREEDGKFMRSLKRVVHVLYTLSTNAALAESIGLVVRPKIPLGISLSLHTLNSHSHQPRLYSLDSPFYSPYVPPLVPCMRFCALWVPLWQAVKDTTASYDALVGLLESMEGFLNRLAIYTKLSLTPIMAEIIVKIMVELLSTLAVTTKQVEQGRTGESVFANPPTTWLNAR